MSVLLVQWNLVRLEMIVFAVIHKKQYKSKEYYAEKSSEETGIEIQI